ncbi:MAG: SpoIIE family protein phosphatase [Bacilli bacterium]|nr:SpoIIE family protein phosphatase [Bacilli bacterium]
MNKLKKIFSSLSFRIISFILVLLVFFSLVVSVIGLMSFTTAFKKEYSTTSYHMAATACSLVNIDHLDNYLENGIDEEYNQTKAYLDAYCDKMNLSLVYIIKVDESDYGRFVSIFNAVNNGVDNTNYTPWELGHKRDTTNDEYKKKYETLYKGEEEYETVFRTRNLNGQNPHITILVPMKASNGKVVALMCIQRPIGELKAARKPYLVNIALSIILVAILTALITIAYLKKQFVQPMRKVANEATRFAKESSQGEKLGNISRIQEISNLAKSVDKMEEDMLSYMNNLTIATKEKEKIGAELSIASTIQENSIPNNFPAFPERSDFGIYASMTPAKVVGGDFYNFFLIDDDHLAIVIADVSGKGIPAALFMMVTNILISDRTRMGGTPGEILTFVNEGICKHNEADMFVTVWLGIVQLSTGKIVASNAGHDDPAIYHDGGSFELFKNKHGLVIGANANAKYNDYEIDLHPGDKLFLYTDGVTEATNTDKELYGMNRMVNALNECKASSPKEILDFIHSDVDKFVGEAPQFDDLTMVCFELNKKEENKLVVKAKNENLYQVMEFIDEFLEKHDCQMKAQTQIDLSIEEVFVNIANYAYGEGEGDCEIKLGFNDGVVTLQFIDSGMPFDPLAKADPDNTLSAEDRQIGGLGIFLVKKNMDEVSYQYLDNKNILTLTKKIN